MTLFTPIERHSRQTLSHHPSRDRLRCYALNNAPQYSLPCISQFVNVTDASLLSLIHFSFYSVRALELELFIPAHKLQQTWCVNIEEASCKPTAALTSGRVANLYTAHESFSFSTTASINDKRNVIYDVHILFGLTRPNAINKIIVFELDLMFPTSRRYDNRMGPAEHSATSWYDYRLTSHGASTVGKICR